MDIEAWFSQPILKELLTGAIGALLAHLIHEAARGQLMDGDEAVGLA